MLGRVAAHVKAIGAGKAVGLAHGMEESWLDNRGTRRTPGGFPTATSRERGESTGSLFRIQKRLGAKLSLFAPGHHGIEPWMFLTLARANLRSGPSVDDEPHHPAPGGGSPLDDRLKIETDYGVRTLRVIRRGQRGRPPRGFRAPPARL
jgi:hypothetical protein